MKKCKLESYSIKSVTIIYTDTTFSSVVFIAYQTSATKSFPWSLLLESVIIITCFKILFFNPVVIFKIAFTSSLIMFLNFNFSMFIWLNTCSISALEPGIGYIKCIEQNQASFLYMFSPMASSYKHTSVQYATVSTFCQGTIIKGSGYRTTHGSSYFKTYSTVLPCMTRFE